MIISFFILFVTLIFGNGANAQQLSYHGRIIDSVTNLGVSGPVTFKVQVRTPTGSPDNCLMYEEQIPRNIVNGVFVIGINNGTGLRTDTTGYTVQQIFSNKNTFGAFNLQETARLAARLLILLQPMPAA